MTYDANTIPAVLITPAPVQENTVPSTAHLIESNTMPEFWNGDHKLFRLDPPVTIDESVTAEYVVTVVVSDTDETVPAELRAAKGTSDGAWFPVFADGSPDRLSDVLLGPIEQREVIGTATHESILALIPAEAAA